MGYDADGNRTSDGTKVINGSQPSLSTNRYRYAGKEEQDIAGTGLSLVDFGAQYYDAFTCRWNAIAPLAEKYFGMSPYNYCGNDPVNFYDPDGREIIFSDDCSDDFKKGGVDILFTEEIA